MTSTLTLFSPPQMLFDLAIDLKRIEVIADDEDEICEAVRRMHKHYDLVITTGGIGASPLLLSRVDLSAFARLQLTSSHFLQGLHTTVCCLPSKRSPPLPDLDTDDLTIVDITYQSIAKAFDKELEYDEETKRSSSSFPLPQPY